MTETEARRGSNLVSERGEANSPDVTVARDGAAKATVDKDLVPAVGAARRTGVVVATVLVARMGLAAAHVTIPVARADLVVAASREAEAQVPRPG